jgi:hypothetical protein
MFIVEDYPLEGENFETALSMQANNSFHQNAMF